MEGTPEQINSVLIFWTPLLKLKYEPIREAAKYVEQYMKSKWLSRQPRTIPPLFLEPTDMLNQRRIVVKISDLIYSVIWLNPIMLWIVLGRFGLVYRQLHASWGVRAEKLGEAVKFVGLGTVFPVHCEEPEVFKKYYFSLI